MSFDDLKKSQESKYAHQEQVDFAVEARCSKLFGIWIGHQIGLEDTDAQTYALEVVESNLEEPGFEDVLRKVKKDLDEKNVEISDHRLRVELDKCLEEARTQIKEQGQ